MVKEVCLCLRSWMLVLGCMEGLGGLKCTKAEFWMNSGSAAEGGFGRRTCLRMHGLAA